MSQGSRPRRNLAAFLYPEPPVKADDVAGLFVDRQDELQGAIARIEALLEDPQFKVLSVVGLARVGKSHFLRRLVAEVRQQVDTLVEVRLAQGLPDTAGILREILDKVLAMLEITIRERGLGTPEGPSPLAPVDVLVHTYREAIYGRKMELSSTDTVATQLAHKFSGSGKLTGKLASLWRLLQPFDLGGELSLQAERSQSKTDTRSQAQKIDVQPFTEEQLCELIGLAHNLVCEAHAKQDGTAHPTGQSSFKTLIVIDDFDLLARQADGQLNPQPLLRSLHSLAQFEGLHVLTTVRSDTYENFDKNFYEVAFIAPFAKPELLIEIYRRHVERLHVGEAPFDPSFVAEAAERCEGRVGIFLKFLHRALTRVTSGHERLRFHDHMREQWEELVRQVPWGAEHIEQAITQGGGMLRASDAAELRKTAAMRVLFEDYSSEGTLTVDPILRSYRREQRGQ